MSEAMSEDMPVVSKLPLCHGSSGSNGEASMRGFWFPRCSRGEIETFGRLVSPVRPRSPGAPVRDRCPSWSASLFQAWWGWTKLTCGLGSWGRCPPVWRAGSRGWICGGGFRRYGHVPGRPGSPRHCLPRGASPPWGSGVGSGLSVRRQRRRRPGHGVVPWRISSRLRLSLLAPALALVLAATGLSPYPYVLIAWVGVGGLFVSPAITTAYLITDESVGPAARTQAGTWVDTAPNAGSAGAAAAAGWLVDRMPLPLRFVVAATPAVPSAATVLQRSRRPPERGLEV